MKVQRIRVENFALFRDVDIRLPDKGLVLVTGKNGRGKSSLLEAVSYGGWKKSLRGTSPWVQEGKAGSVMLNTSMAEIERLMSAKGRASVEWSAPSGYAVEYETPTKAQEALEAVIGSFDIWVRSCTFSKAFSANFAVATDSERKQLLETILGLDRFEPGLKRVRVDLKVVRDACLSLESKLALEEQTLHHRRENLANATRDLSELKVPPEQPKPTPQELPTIPDYALDVAHVRLNPQVVAFDEETKKAQQFLDMETAAEAAMDKELTATQQKVTALEVELAGLVAAVGSIQAGICTTCGQSVTQAHIERLHKEANESQRWRKERLTAEKANLAQQRTSREEMKENQAVLRQRMQALGSQRAQLVGQLQEKDSGAVKLREQERKAATEQRKLVEAANAAALREWTTAEKFRREMLAKQQALTARRNALEEQTAAAEKDVESQQALVRVKRHDRAVLEAVEFALSTKGIRAHVLGKALAGLELAVNRWLLFIGYDLQVELRAYSEKKSEEGLKDAISVVMTGSNGRRREYRSLSDGEKRRGDIAFLCALMDITQAALGQAGSTLWLDEVFDALDADGTRAVLSLLDSLAQSRTVVVIAHSPAFIEAIRPAFTLHVEADPSDPEVSIVVQHRGTAGLRS